MAAQESADLCDDDGSGRSYDPDGDRCDVGPYGVHAGCCGGRFVHVHGVGAAGAPTNSATEENLGVTIGFTVTDGDGDTATGQLTVNVNDDTPTTSVNLAVQLDDDALTGGNPGGIGDVTPDTANTTGVLAHCYGADGAGSTLLTGAGLARSVGDRAGFIAGGDQWRADADDQPDPERDRSSSGCAVFS